MSRDDLKHPIEFSGKVVEEVGFDKISEKLAELQELRVVLLDDLCVAGALAHEDESQKLGEAKEAIGMTCPKISELDLSRNLISRWNDVGDICDQLKRLRVLKLK